MVCSLFVVRSHQCRIALLTFVVFIYAAGRKQTPPFMSQAMFPHIVLWAVLLLSNVTSMHIQIITRAFSCLPPVYWFAAHQFGDKEYGLRVGYARSVTTFFVMYGLIGVILFANFFPPA